MRYHKFCGEEAMVDGSPMAIKNFVENGNVSRSSGYNELCCCFLHNRLNFVCMVVSFLRHGPNNVHIFVLDEESHQLGRTCHQKSEAARYSFVQFNLT